MASTVTFIEYLSSETATATPTQLDLVSTIAPNASRSTYPVSVGNYSQTKAFKIRFDGTFTNVSQVKLYKSDGAYLTGETIAYGVSSSYHVPTGGAYEDSVADTAIPTSLPATANVTIGGDLGGTITGSGATDFVYLQSSVTIQAISATANSKTLTVTWTEVA